MQAHLGIAIHGFPNLFMLLGPNTGLGHNSVLLMIEAQLGYLRKLLRYRASHGLATVEPTPGGAGAVRRRRRPADAGQRLDRRRVRQLVSGQDRPQLHAVARQRPGLSPAIGPFCADRLARRTRPSTGPRGATTRRPGNGAGVAVTRERVTMARTRVEVDGRTAFVSGAASGIGRAVAVRLAEYGCPVAIADQDEQGLDQTAELIGGAVLCSPARRPRPPGAARVCRRGGGLGPVADRHGVQQRRRRHLADGR